MVWDDLKGSDDDEEVNALISKLMGRLREESEADLKRVNEMRNRNKWEHLLQRAKSGSKQRVENLARRERGTVYRCH